MPAVDVLGSGTHVVDLLLEQSSIQPSTGTWQLAAEMASPRSVHTATVLAGGDVLVAAGFRMDNSAGNPYVFIGSSEIYDPSTDTWSTTGQIGFGDYYSGRRDHSATLLKDGRVLIAGRVQQRRGK